MWRRSSYSSVSRAVRAARYSALSFFTRTGLRSASSLAGVSVAVLASMAEGLLGQVEHDTPRTGEGRAIRHRLVGRLMSESRQRIAPNGPMFLGMTQYALFETAIGVAGLA